MLPAPPSRPLQQSKWAHICLISLCHYLRLLVRSQQSDRLTAVGGELCETKKTKAAVVISAHIPREGLTKRLTSGAPERKGRIGK